MTPDPQRPRSRARFRAGLVLCALAALALLSGCSPEKAAPEPEDPPRAERVPDILGREGWQISLGIGAAAVTSWYFAATPAGAELVLDVGSSQEAEVTDLDGDGQGEAWEFYNHGDTGWSFYDRDESGRYWRYFLTAGPEAPLGAVMVPEKGYVPADREGNPLLGEDGNILGPYVLEDGALHLRMEEPP